MPWSDKDALTPQALNSRSGLVFNVKDPEFGATGDSTTDDGPAIQATIDAAADSAEAGQDGATSVVLIPGPGGYHTGQRIIHRNRVTVHGVGRGAVVAARTANFSSNTELWSIGDGSTTTNTHGALVENLVLSANNITGSVVVRSNNVQEGSGLYNCVLKSYQSAGVYFNGGKAANFILEKLHLFPTGTHSQTSAARGIFLDSCVNSVVVRDVVVGGSDSGITHETAFRILNTTAVLENVRAERHTDNILLDNNAGGIIVHAGGHSTISNVVRSISTRGIVCYGIQNDGSTNAVADQNSGRTAVDGALYISTPDNVFFSSDPNLSNSIGSDLGVGTSSSTQSLAGTALKTVVIGGATRPQLLLKSTAGPQESRAFSDGAGLFVDIAGHATASNNAIILRTGQADADFTLTEAARIRHDGILALSAATIRLTEAPTGGGLAGDAPGTTGDIAWGSSSNVSFLYVCTSASSWMRATLNPF